MGICNATGCCRDYEIVRTFENNGFHNNLNSIEEKIFLNNGKLITNEQLILNKQYFNIINDIRENPSNYINESKSHNLLEIFIKLKPSKPLRLSDNNIFTIKVNVTLTTSFSKSLPEKMIYNFNLFP